MTYDSLPCEFRKRLENCLLTTFAGMNAMDVANILFGLGQMDCSWTSVSPALKACFQQVTVDNLPAMRGFDIYSTLQGLANMGATWTNLNQELLRSIQQAVIGILTQRKHLETALGMQEVALIIHLLGELGARWSAFSPAFHTAVVDAFIFIQRRFQPHKLSKFLYG